MSDLDFCLITPSYKSDFARCRLLCESIDLFSLVALHHYVVVDARDFKLFQQLETSNRTVLTVESIMPWWIQNIPLIRNGWFSFKTLPVRNWLIQQIVKLEIANHIQEEVLVFVDSDVTFIRPFDVRDLIIDGRVKLYRESTPLSDWQPALSAQWCKWRNSATSLLDLPAFPEYSDSYPVVNYVGNFIIWKRDNVLQLHRHIEKVTRRSWIESVVKQWYCSEYMLYGIFVDCILQEKSGHYWDSRKVSHDYWDAKPLTEIELEQFFADIPSELFAVMVSAKADIPVNHYQSFIEQMYLEWTCVKPNLTV